jgi:hypothetical protein
MTVVKESHKWANVSLSGHHFYLTFRRSLVRIPTRKAAVITEVLRGYHSSLSKPVLTK